MSHKLQKIYPRILLPQSVLPNLGLFAFLASLYYALYCLLVWIKPVSGSNLLLVIAAASFLATKAVRIWQREPLVNGNEFLIFALLALCWASISYNLYYGKEVYDVENRPALLSARNHLIFATLWLFVGASISTATLKRSDLLSILLLAIMAVGVVLGVINTGGEIDIQYYELNILHGLEPRTITHFDFGLAATVVWALAYASAKRLRIVVLLAGLLIVFPLGGRSTFFFTYVAIVGYEVLIHRTRGIGKVIAAVLVTAAVATYAVTTGLVDLESSETQHMLVSEGLEEDSSAEQRVDIFERSIGYLTQTPLLGDPTFFATKFGYNGTYIHNLLSAWQYFGVIAFGLFVFALYRAFRTGWQRCRQDDEDPIIVFGFIVLLYTILAQVSTQYVFHKMLWFSLGFWLLYQRRDVVGALQKKRRRRRRRRSKHSDSQIAGASSPAYAAVSTRRKRRSRRR